MYSLARIFIIKYETKKNNNFLIRFLLIRKFIEIYLSNENVFLIPSFRKSYRITDKFDWNRFLILSAQMLNVNFTL